MLNETGPWTTQNATSQLGISANRYDVTFLVFFNITMYDSLKTGRIQ